MPLFNNWPYVDLSNLNLDWIIMKIKNVEKADAQAQDVIDAAAQILPKVDQVNSDADRASDAATRAEAAADRADTAVTVAASSAQSSIDNAEASASAADAAEAAAAMASNYKNLAETAASDASRYQMLAVQARTGAEDAQTAAEAAANRAESASSTTGYRAYTGILDASTSETVLLPDGTYQLDWFANDQDNSSAIFLLFKSGNSLTYRCIQYNGSGSTAMLISSDATSLTMRNQLTVDMYWFITGCEAF